MKEELIDFIRKNLKIESYAITEISENFAEIETVINGKIITISANGDKEEIVKSLNNQYLSYRNISTIGTFNQSIFKHFGL